VGQMKDVAGALELKLPAEAITKLDDVSSGMRAVLDGNPSDVADDLD